MLEQTTKEKNVLLDELDVTTKRINKDFSFLLAFMAFEALLRFYGKIESICDSDKLAIGMKLVSEALRRPSRFINASVNFVRLHVVT